MSSVDSPPSVRLATLDEAKAQLRRRGQLKGRQVDEVSLAEVRALIGKGPHARDGLIETLHRLQDTYRALYRRHLVALALEMRISKAEVYEVATFYHHFDVLEDDQIPADRTIRVCDGLSCQLAGAAPLMKDLQERLGRTIRVIAAPCVGRCDQAPVAVVDQRPVIHARADAVMALAQDPEVESGQHPSSPPGADFDPVQHVEQALTTGNECLSPAHVGLADYQAKGGYSLLKRLVDGQMSPEQAIVALEHSGLRGLGGAGFPAGRKWRIVREQSAPKLMAVNIDEGEPGTFKDRTYLERDPHRFLEGMLIAAQVVGVSAIYLYLRDEYHGCRALLAAELEQLQAAPPCPLPEIHLRRGAGAYICGEESAMIESIEGKRGEPRMRPPYIAQVGLFGHPTLEHNFETLYWVRDILERGPEWFSGFGRHGRKGLRSFSVSGRVRSPGVKLAPAGISLRELIDEYCGGMSEGHTLYAYLPGGASGGILPAHLADIPLDFDTLQPHGCFIGSAAVMVLSQADRARDAALNVMRFFEHESCGQCTPCRVGTRKAALAMAAPVWDAPLLVDVADVMSDASICGLGQAAPNPIRSVLKHFAHEVGLASKGDVA